MIEFYEDLFAIKADTSPIPNSPEWYFYYIATEELTQDIDQAFGECKVRTIYILKTQSTV